MNQAVAEGDLGYVPAWVKSIGVEDLGQMSMPGKGKGGRRLAFTPNVLADPEVLLQLQDVVMEPPSARLKVLDPAADTLVEGVSFNMHVAIWFRNFGVHVLPSFLCNYHLTSTRYLSVSL